MKTTIEKALMLGIGLAAEGKEQIERVVADLVKKGEVGGMEAQYLAEKLIHRGEESKRQLEHLVQERVQAILSEYKLATVAELKQLELRVQGLEQKECDN